MFYFFTTLNQSERNRKILKVGINHKKKRARVTGSSISMHTEASVSDERDQFKCWPCIVSRLPTNVPNYI